MDLLTELESLIPELEKGLDQASSLQEMEALRVEFLGRKGRIARIMSRLPELEPAQRPLLGQTANRVKESLTAQFEAKKTALDNAEEAAALARFDAGLPGRLPWRGSLHPVTMVMEEICTIFKGLGYDIVSGPEVETDYYCFEALNIPPEHPARDMQDTLYVSDGIVLRTHTSPLQVRTMLKQKPPVAVVAPGRVYRRDSDITHTPMFHQVEGLLVDKHATMADLRETYLMKERKQKTLSQVNGPICAGRLPRSCAKCSVPTPASVSARASSRLRNPAPKPTFPAVCAAGRGMSTALRAACARGPAGWKSSVAAWSILKSSRPLATTRKK